MDRTANRTARFEARCRPKELELVDAAARSRGVHRSEFVRKATIQAAREELAKLAGEGWGRSGG